jgi:membrane protein YdbS with pleckstrin-like domain
MFNAIRNILLRLMRVPPEPDPPQGSSDSLKIFHAGRNFYVWSVIRWGFIQCCIAFPVLGALIAITVGSRAANTPYLARYILGALGWLLTLAYAGQFFVSFFLVRLNYEMRWYIVTDRSLRIRYGVWKLEEMTMTFANIQQINILQGPLQRVLGIANLEVTSAGGGGSQIRSHVGYFEGVDNALQIRDLILERLKRYRDSGLGDPDDHHANAPVQTAEAVHELLSAARDLRKAVAQM